MKSIEGKKGPSYLWQYIAGAVLVSGAVYLLASRFLPANLSLISIVVFAGLILIGLGFRKKSIVFGIVGITLVAAGVSLMYSFSPSFRPSIRNILIFTLIIMAGGWIAIWIFSRLIEKFINWAVIPAVITLIPAGVLYFTKMTILDFVLWIGVGLGTILIIWGLYKHFFGLIIPGCLLLTSGPAVYLAWQGDLSISPLARTGFMLAILAMGWLLITFFARFQLERLLWWPLIPGSVLLVSGLGLYLNGNPSDSMDFIVNTGSIVVLILGLYLLLFRGPARK